MAGPISTWIRDAATGVGRRVREPAVPAATSDAAAASFATLTRKLDYLEASDIKRVREAYRFADEAHLGQFRASGDFAQRGHAGLVLGFDLGGVALAQHAGTVGGCEHQLKAVRDLDETVFDGDAGHGMLR